MLNNSFKIQMCTTSLRKISGKSVRLEMNVTTDERANENMYDEQFNRIQGNKITLSKRSGNVLFMLGERLILTFGIPIFAIKLLGS